jgi:hypothetical protein
MPLWLITAPIATSIAQAGNSSDEGERTPEARADDGHRPHLAGANEVDTACA